jgi:hypothetical protein
MHKWIFSWVNSNIERFLFLLGGAILKTWVLWNMFAVMALFKDFPLLQTVMTNREIVNGIKEWLIEPIEKHSAESPNEKAKKSARGIMAQVVECLLSKRKALCSSPSTTKKFFRKERSGLPHCSLCTGCICDWEVGWRPGGDGAF